MLTKKTKFKLQKIELMKYLLKKHIFLMAKNYFYQGFRSVTFLLADLNLWDSTENALKFEMLNASTKRIL